MHTYFVHVFNYLLRRNFRKDKFHILNYMPIQTQPRIFPVNRYFVHSPFSENRTGCYAELRFISFGDQVTILKTVYKHSRKADSLLSPTATFLLHTSQQALAQSSQSTLMKTAVWAVVSHFIRGMPSDEGGMNVRWRRDFPIQHFHLPPAAGLR